MAQAEPGARRQRPRRIGGSVSLPVPWRGTPGEERDETGQRNRDAGPGGPR